jgi:dihydrodipicolinate synthase/N-acetylneuraminate lyase
MLSAQDIRGVYAIIPTPAKEGSNRLDAVDTVDLDESARLINALIADGVSGLIVLGTTGECATLIRKDYDAFAGCVLETVNRRIPTFVGTTALGGHEIASRMRFIRDLGADGTLLGLPMWQPLTTPMAVDYYSAMSECFPSTAIMVYANARAFRYTFPLEFWDAVAMKAPTVIAAKYSRPKGLKELIAATGNRVNFVPNEMTVTDFFATSPESTTACWATSAAMGPVPVVALMDAMLNNKLDAMKEIDAALNWANDPVKPLIENPEAFASFNIQVEKTRINAAGYSRCGPMRPPYDYIPPDYEAASRECGHRWATLRKKYTGQAR